MVKKNSFTEIDEGDVRFWEDQCKEDSHLSGERLLNLIDKEIGYHDVCERVKVFLWCLCYRFLRFFS